MAFKNLKWSLVSGELKADTQFPEQQVQYLGKTANSFAHYPYGMHSNAAIGALALMFSVGDHSENRVVLACDPAQRPELLPGEVMFYHPLLPTTLIYLKNDGTVAIKSAVSVDVTAPEASFSGNVTIAGNLSVTGATSLSDAVTSNGVNISDTHKHSGVTTGSGSTGNPV